MTGGDSMKEDYLNVQFNEDFLDERNRFYDMITERLMHKNHTRAHVLSIYPSLDAELRSTQTGCPSITTNPVKLDFICSLGLPSGSRKGFQQKRASSGRRLQTESTR